MWRSILVLIDLSENSDLLLKYAHNFAMNSSAKLYVLHVVQFHHENLNYIFPFPAKENFYEQLIEEARKEIDSILPEGKNHIEVLVECGKPEKIILNIIKNMNIDLIIRNGSRTRFIKQLFKDRCPGNQVESKSSVPVLLFNNEWQRGTFLCMR
jgi:nucleotide-binding universal stress UspA family protein